MITSKSSPRKETKSIWARDESAGFGFPRLFLGEITWSEYVVLWSSSRHCTYIGLEVCTDIHGATRSLGGNGSDTDPGLPRFTSIFSSFFSCSRLIIRYYYGSSTRASSTAKICHGHLTRLRDRPPRALRLPWVREAESTDHRTGDPLASVFAADGRLHLCRFMLYQTRRGQKTVDLPSRNKGSGLDRLPHRSKSVIAQRDTGVVDTGERAD